MRLPRKGVLIRLAIYVPLIGFLSWNAITNCQARRAAEDAAATPAPNVQERLEPHKRMITMPDGSQQAIYELTPEEAQELLGAPVNVPAEAKPPGGEANGQTADKSDGRAVDREAGEPSGD